MTRGHRIAARLAVLSAALACAATAGAEPRSPSAWTPAVRERMLDDAAKVAPPALARLVLRHADALRTGMAEMGLAEGGGPHRQDDDLTVGAAEALRIASDRAVEAIDSHRPMSEVAYHLGVAAHLAADLNDPLLTSPDGDVATWAADYGLFVERSVHLFPVVFYGYPALDVPPQLDAHGSARTARPYLAHVARAYGISGGSSAAFDVRSVPFGVSSVCYSRAVSDIARVWLYVWRRARGDLAGTPYLTGAPPAPAPPRIAVSPPPARPAATPPAAAPAAGAAVEEGGGEPPPITKTIIGKSRRRKSKGAQPDPNGTETNDAPKD